MLCRPVSAILWMIPAFFILSCPEGMAATPRPDVTYGTGDSFNADMNSGSIYVGPNERGDEVVRVTPPRQPEQPQPSIPYIIPQVETPWQPNRPVQPQPGWPGSGNTLPPRPGFPGPGQPPYPPGFPGQPGWQPQPPSQPVPPGNLQPPAISPPAVMPPAMRPQRPPANLRPPLFRPPPAGQRPPVPPSRFPSRPANPMPPGGVYNGPQIGFPVPPPNGSFGYDTPRRPSYR